jgi:copper transporter 1
MDHGNAATGMSMATSTASAAAAATGMSGMGGGSGCKISVSWPTSHAAQYMLTLRRQMLWNWYTIDSCFIASSWKVNSTGAFAGSCIGVVLLVISLEMLRRAVKEYDRFLINKHLASAVATTNSPKGASDDDSPAPACTAAVGQGYRPTVFEQALRALLHMLQFAVAYFVMLCVPLYRV